MNKNASGIRGARLWTFLPTFASTALVLAALAMLPACGGDTVIIADKNLEPGANIKLGNFYREAVDVDGNKDWEISATEAYIFQERGGQSRIVTYNFTFEQYDARQRKIASITADRGEINYKDRRLYLEGEVEYKGKTRRIEAEKMEYQMDDKVVTSRVPVKLWEGGTFTNCRGGVVVDNKKDRQVCKGPAGVRVSTKGKKGGGIDDIFQ